MTQYLKLSFIACGFLFLFSTCKQTPSPAIEIQEGAISLDGTISISEKQFNSSGYETASLTERDFYTTLPVSGKVHLPQRYITTVSSYIGGIVDNMNQVEGHWVKKGQTLFTISNPELIDIQQQYLELKSQLDFLKDESERQKLLSEENISAKKFYIKAQADLHQAEAKYAGIAKRLSLLGIAPQSLTTENMISTLTIYSPASGYVTAININKGSFLNPTEPAIEISSTEGLHLELHALEKDLSKIAIDQPVVFSLPSDTSKKYTSSVHLIEKVVDENGLVSVHCDLEPSKTQNLISGTYVNAEIHLATQRKLALPSEAIVTVNNQSYALLQSTKDKTLYTETEVIPGKITDGFIAIENANDFAKDAVFLSKGAYYLVSGE
jgi:membrane fusion protein, heavy metal efflux system